MKHNTKKTLFIGIILGFIVAFAYPALAEVTNNYWLLSAGTIKPNIASWTLTLPYLPSQNCIGTDINGLLEAGTCGGTSGSFLSTTSPWTAMNLAQVVDNGHVTSISTSTLYGAINTPGYVLSWENGVPNWVATTTFSGGLTYSNGNVTCTGCNSGTVTSVTGTWPILSSGGNTPVISWGGLATSSNLTEPNILYSTGVNTVGNTATSSITLNNGLGSSGTGYVIGSSFNIFNANQIATSSISRSGVAWFNSTVPTQVESVATTSDTITGPFNFASTLSVLGSGTAAYYGLATTSNISANQVLYGTSASGVASEATGTISCAGSDSCGSGSWVLGNNLTITGNGFTSYDAFTHATQFGSFSSATSTQIHFSGTPAITASSTMYVGTAGSDFYFSGSNIGVASDTPGSIVSLGSSSGSDINLRNTSTSTFDTTNGGINVLSGCFAVKGVCVGSGGSGTVTSVGLSSTNSTLTIGSTPVTTSGTITADLNLSHSNTWLATQIFNDQIGIGTSTPFSMLSVSTTTASAPTTPLFAVASSTNATLLNVLGGGYVGVGTSSPSSQFLLSVGGAAGSTNGNILASGEVSADNFYDTSLSGNTCVGQSSSLLGTSNCVSSIAQTYGTGQNGNITLATSSANASFNGLTASTTITNASGVFNFIDSLAGLLGIGGGGTGDASFTAGQVLYGNGTNALASVATVTPSLSAGLSYSGATLPAGVGGSTGTLHNVINPSFSYSTTSPSGTTTIPLEVAYGETWNNVKCSVQPNGASAEVRFYYNTNSGATNLAYLNASSTVGTIAIGAAATAAATTSVDIGNWASTPTSVNCTANITN